MHSGTPLSSKRSDLFAPVAPTRAARQVVAALVLCLAWFLSVQSANAGAAFVQGNSTVATSTTSSISTTFNSAQLSGDLNILVVGSHYGVTISSVTDQSGNTYHLAIGPTADGSLAGAQSIYYAANIAAASAGSNTVTVAFSGSSSGASLRAVEYSGIVTANPLDVAGAAVCSSNSNVCSSGSITTE